MRITLKRVHVYIQKILFHRYECALTYGCRLKDFFNALKGFQPDEI